MTLSELPPSRQDGGAPGVAMKYNKRVCATCRRRHYKCDGVGPRCAQCKIAGLECVWSDKTRAPSRNNDVAQLRERLAVLEATVERLVARSASPLADSLTTSTNGGTSQWTLTPASSSDFASPLESGTDPLDPLLPARSAIPPSNLTWCAPSTSNDFTTAYQLVGHAPQPPPAVSIVAPGAWTANPLPIPSGPAVLTLRQREGALPEDVRTRPAGEDFANAGPGPGLGVDFLSEMWGA